MLKKILIIPCAVFLFAAMAGHSHAAWFIYHKSAFKGRVIDSETKEPIEGAVVVATYSKKTHLPPHAYSTVIDVREALTDKNGEFRISSYTTLIQPLSSEEWARFIIFKPGYGSYPNYHTSPPRVGVDPEVFFSSEETGTEGEIEWEGMGKRYKVVFGVVELPRLKTREEREKTLSRADRSHELPCYKIKNLIRLVNEEYKNLGYTHQVREDCNGKKD